MWKNNIYRQSQKLKGLKNRAKQNDLMKKPERLIIIDVISKAKSESKTLSIKEICDNVNLEIGDVFSESVIRHNINDLIKEDILITKVKKDINHIILGKEIEIKEFIPTMQLIPMVTTTLLSLIILAYNVLISFTEYYLLALTLIGYNSLLILFNYLEYEYDIKTLKISLLESLNHLKSQIKKLDTRQKS